MPHVQLRLAAAALLSAVMLIACVANPTPYPANDATSGAVSDAAGDSGQVALEDTANGHDQGPPPSGDVDPAPDPDGPDTKPPGPDAIVVGDNGEGPDAPAPVDVVDVDSVAPDADAPTPDAADAELPGPDADATTPDAADVEHGWLDAGDAELGWLDAADIELGWADAEAEVADAEGPVEGCFAEQSCGQGFEMCWQPGESLPCGMCYQPMPDEVCADDGDCGAEQICAWDVGLCTCGGEKLCVPACVADGCDEGEVCGADGHCAPSPCGGDDECPANFGCDGSGCLRLDCETSDVCDGYCVNGECFDQPGYCSPPPP